MGGHPAVPRAYLVTGCSSGIGRATALRLAGRGHAVWASARRLEDVADLEAQGCRTVQLDVTDEASMQAAVKAVEAEHFAVSGLVNNAGYALEGAVEALDPGALRRQFETNVFGLVRLTQLVLPGMRRQRWGRVVNLSSMGGRLTFPGGGAYHATKHAVEAFGDALRNEVRGFGVRVSLVEPGLVATRFGETATAHLAGAARPDDPYGAFHAAVGRRISGFYSGPMSRFGTRPEAVARAVERALTARRPRSRYRVGLDARALITLRRLSPDRAWDALMRVVFPPPR